MSVDAFRAASYCVTFKAVLKFKNVVRVVHKLYNAMMAFYRSFYLI